MRYIIESTKAGRRNGVYYVRDRHTDKVYTFGSRKAAQRWIDNQEVMDAHAKRVLG